MTGKQLASLAHPARRAALEQIALGPASPDDIAKQSGIPLGVVAYHIRALAAANLNGLAIALAVSTEGVA